MVTSGNSCYNFAQSTTEEREKEEGSFRKEGRGGKEKIRLSDARKKNHVGCPGPTVSHPQPKGQRRGGYNVRKRVKKTIIGEEGNGVNHDGQKGEKKFNPVQEERRSWIMGTNL